MTPLRLRWLCGVTTASLAAGLFAAGCSNPSGRSAPLPVTPLPATLNLSPQAIAVTREVGSPPAVQTATVGVGGDLSTGWTARSTAPWLQLGSASGQGDQTISLTLDPQGLGVGIHQAQLEVDTTAGLHAQVPVTLTLTPVATQPLSATPTSLSFQSVVGQASPAAETCSVQAAASSTWAVTSLPAWLTANPAQGQGTGSFAVSPNPTGLAAGVYTGTVEIAAASQHVSVSVTWDLRAPPVGPQPNQPPAVSNVTAPAGVQGGTILLDYTLADDEGDVCSVQVEFSTDGGNTYRAATAGVGGDGTQSLSATSAGTAHHFAWDSLRDEVGSATAIVRITPRDGTQSGTASASASFTVLNPVLQLLDLNSAWWPLGLPSSWTHVKLGYTRPVTAEAANGFMPWWSAWVKRGTTSGGVRVILLQLLVRDASGNVTVVAEDDFTAQREVAWGIWTTSPWYGTQLYNPGWLTHPAAADGTHHDFTAAGNRPDAAPDDTHHGWLAHWPRPLIPAALRASVVEIGVRAVIEVHGDCLVGIGLDRYATATITGTSVGNGQWEHIHSGWFYSVDGSPQTIDKTVWTSITFQ